MKTILLLASLISFASIAKAQDLFCQLKVNNDTIVDTKISTVEGKNVVIGNYQNYTISARKLGSQKFYIEVYETNVSRTYADGVLRNEDDEIKWTLWTREILMEVSCKLAI